MSKNLDEAAHRNAIREEMLRIMRASFEARRMMIEIGILPPDDKGAKSFGELIRMFQPKTEG